VQGSVKPERSRGQDCFLAPRFVTQLDDAVGSAVIATRSAVPMVKLPMIPTQLTAIAAEFAVVAP
jgi:hypothetical protein